MAQTPSALPPSTSAPPPPEDTTRASGLTVGRVVFIAAAALVLIIVAIFVIALLLAQGDVDRLGPYIEIARDIVIIFLALQGILIIVALAILIVQIARLINLLQTEIKPVLQNTQETLSSARGTIEFVGDTVTSPVIKASAFLAGVGVVTRNLAGIRRALRPSERNGNHEPTP